MSTRLLWATLRPVNVLSTQLKFVLREFLGQSTVDTTLHAEDLPVLHAMKASSTSAEVKKSLDELIAAVEAHNEIKVWEND